MKTDTTELEKLIEENKTLSKEVDRLTRRNKILTKRAKKLEEENTKLGAELDELESLNSVEYLQEPTCCPLCGETIMTYTKPDDSTIKRCANFPICRYKG